MSLLVNVVCLLVYRCISCYCIFYHDRPLSWYRSHISWILMKRYKHRDLSKTQIYQQVLDSYTETRYVCISNCVSVTTVYSITIDLYRDINPIYRGYSWKDISIAAYPNLRYTNKSMSLLVNRYACWYIATILLDHDRSLSWY